MSINKLILYRNFEYEDLFNYFRNLIDIVKENKQEDFDEGEMEAIVNELYKNVNFLIELTGKYGFKGNIWRNFLAFIIANNENAFSTSYEISPDNIAGMKKIAYNDFKVFKELFDYDMKKIDVAFHVDCLSLLEDFQNDDTQSRVFNQKIRDRVHQLGFDLFKAADVEEYFHIVTDFYKNYGVGKFGLHKAFRLKEEKNQVSIVPITNIQHITLDSLIGYELQKKKLVDNTKAFVQGKKANNVLLFGDSGTGKSSSIKAVLNEYYPMGLRMIEVYKHEFRHLSDVTSQIKDRKYKFIIFMDDLSFEDYEIEYKYLKAIIEGGIAIKPDNVLIYATSNRRHLVREKWSDKEDRREDLHASDTVQEKLSLAARFGVSIFYSSPDKKEFEHIVTELAERYNIHMEREKLLLEANKWEISHGGLSGRTAIQFVNYLQGNIAF